MMGWYVVMQPSVVTEETQTAIGIMCSDVFGSGWGQFEIAHLATADGIGMEIFSFSKMDKKAPAFQPFHTGLFHFCVQDPDVQGLVDKIVAHGGKQRMPVRHYYPGDKPYCMCYVEDPFGIVFEVYSHSYVLTYSLGAYAK
ncbi:VOC family protein [Mucilaginibacter robiniae]|uniref:VOC family protein n=1 Tax=Mucilaginibacter robiniae TaxID=2728022 RepID=UPI0028F44FF6|nr:VOC family protein [Mucilaginibacter robiniae]